MLPYFSELGIIFQSSCVGTPQLNDRVERKHLHILNVDRALIFQGNLPKSFWGECILGAVYLIDHTPSSLLQNKTPFEILCRKTPPLDHLLCLALCVSLIINALSKSTVRLFWLS